LIPGGARVSRAGDRFLTIADFLVRLLGSGDIIQEKIVSA